VAESHSSSVRIVVLVKSAVDEAELRADASGHPVLKGAAKKMSNFDRNGVEEALKLSEANGGAAAAAAVTVLTLGSADSTKAIKEALAMGATRAIHILLEGDGGHADDGNAVASAPPPIATTTAATSALDSLCTAYYLAQAIKQKVGETDVVFCSEGASDTYTGEVGAMVAEFLGMPFLAYARRVEVVAMAAGEDEQGMSTSRRGRMIRCEQAFEGEVRVSQARLPAVVSMVSGSNSPRYPTLLQVMAAGKKPIEQVPLASLKGPDCPDSGIEVLDVSLQVDNRKRIIFEGSPDETSRMLVDALRREGAGRGEGGGFL
jgi:electron transfer flavoprotein beta subunit